MTIRSSTDALVQALAAEFPEPAQRGNPGLVGTTAASMGIVMHVKGIACHSRDQSRQVIFHTGHDPQQLWTRPERSWLVSLTDAEATTLRDSRAYDLFNAALPADRSRWRHFKGGTYLITGWACCLDHQSPLVLYRSIDRTHDTIWARPLAEWHQAVGFDDGVGMPRFHRLEDA